MFRNLIATISILAVSSLSGRAQSNAVEELPMGCHWQQDAEWRQDVGIEGTHLTLNGHPWSSRGVALQGFVRPLAQLESELAANPENQQAAQLLKARRRYGRDELEF